MNILPKISGRFTRLGTGVTLTLFSTLLFAGTEPLMRTKTVPYDDLNVASAQGAARLYQRIASAAKEVCKPETDSGSRLLRAAYRKCFTNAVSEAIAEVRHPQLSAQVARIAHERDALTQTAAK